MQANSVIDRRNIFPDYMPLDCTTGALLGLIANSASSHSKKPEGEEVGREGERKDNEQNQLLHLVNRSENPIFPVTKLPADL